ncbi:hypothetical protein ENSA5_17170 [Enhygromyxa salina]|uniref:Uncharacterized protein n=1 Tax=Enhygromyxa salina TaxID=215803 RepID=A0A2S9YDX7_9BACT|nr:hypothetical protein [Enhygromyxa salina]PRQ03327.1 hypothetical protein ENSA5_17170 [Enhygromyxa salina]
MEIVELVDGAPASQEPAKLRERSGWLSRVLERNRANRFVLDPTTAPVETLQILGDREDFALLEIDETGRPVLHVLPGMAGELRIGVCCMSVEHMLADPALRDPELGGARLPLPYGARIRVVCGPRIFVARVGGPPLMRTPLPAAEPSIPQLLHA